MIIYRYCIQAILLLALTGCIGIQAQSDTQEAPPATPPTVMPEPQNLTTSVPPTEPALADADVLFVRAGWDPAGHWTFSVQVEHPDTGWEDYADGWDVVTPDGTVLKPDPSSPFTRLLLHPHVGEQPFTRSQSGIIVPEGVSQVTVRAHDLIHGFGGRQVLVDLTQDKGEDFEVLRGDR